MKRIMFWNIENFSRNKIDNPVTNRRQKGSTLTLRAASLQRLNYIQQQVVAAQPDILVVVELETPGGVRGSLAGGNALPACRAILNMLRALDAQWMMVPPLKVGTREAVAVFYRAGAANVAGYFPNGLYFTGPYVWTGAVAAAGGIGVVPVGYATVGWANTLGRNVPAGAQYNSGALPPVNEAACAARVTFTRRNDPADMLAGQAYDFGAQRAPYMVTFAEMNPAGTAVARNITLFAVHSPASYNGAHNYLDTVLPGLEEVTDALGATEMRVIAGDFNVNVIHSGPPNQYDYNQSYDALYDYDYALCLKPDPQYDTAPPNPPLGYRGYFATHMRGARTASFLGTVNAPQYYPGYDYIGAETGNYFAIDNIYVRYRDDVDPPNPDNFTVLNGCVGSAYNVVANPVGEPPLGTIAFASQMPALAVVNPAAAFAAGQRSRLRGWNNFGRIRSTSDHMALVMDI